MRQINPFHQTSDKRFGFTLIEVLLSVAILGVVATILLSNLKTQMDQLRSFDLRLQINSLRDDFVRRVDCAQTLASFRNSATGAITCNNTFKLKDASGTALLDNAGHLTGGDSRWTFSASCGTRSIEVRGTLYFGSTTAQDYYLGTINATNAQVNPLLGSNVAYKLCSQMFGLGARVESYSVALGSLPVTPALTATDCANMSNRPFGQYLTETTAYLQRGINACSQYCVGQGFYSGFISHCDSVNATCECLR